MRDPDPSAGPGPDPEPGPTEDEALDVGPYGLRGKHTPPLANMLGGYGIIFAVLVLLPLVLFLVFRLFIL
jgi:hypothetical protein